MAKPKKCPCCAVGQSKDAWSRKCPHCGHRFKSGWRGVSSHLRSEAAMASHPWTFEEFWNALCEPHGFAEDSEEEA
jgi:hypothetical protein